MNINKKHIGLLLISLYLTTRVGLEQIFWRKHSVYYSYLFELIFVIFSSVLLKRNLSFKRISSSSFIFSMLISLLSGFLIFSGAGLLATVIPFDFSSLETLFLLLILAPILEELIFRFALWNSLKTLTEKKMPLLLLTSLLFSAGHFSAYWFVPSQFQGFVLYQTFYTFLLALYAGYQKIKHRTILAPVSIHFFFNLGFFLGNLYRK